MRYKLETQKNEKGVLQFKTKISEGVTSYFALNEENHTILVSREWVNKHVIDIDNLRFTSDGKIYPCASKNRKVQIALKKAISKLLHSTTGFSPACLLPFNNPYFFKDTSEVWHLNRECLTKERVLCLEQSKEINDLVTLLALYGSRDFKTFMPAFYNSLTLDKLLFECLEDEEKDGKIVLMLIDEETWAKYFFSYSMPTTSHSDKWKMIERKVEEHRQRNKKFYYDYTINIPVMKTNFSYYELINY